MRSRFEAGVRLAVVAIASVAAYHRFVRPLHVHWGATSDEARRVMPGDETVREPYVVTTRAVTVDARPADVWPWLVQIGDGRGGLYSYDWLDRLFGFTSQRSADTILPQFQALAVGDTIPLGRGPSWQVIGVDAGHALVLEPVPRSVTWCFELLALDSGATRLVSRVRVRLWSKPVLWVVAPLVDAVWFLMERRMLLGIKERAEALR